MGLQFRRSKKIAKGVRLNVGSRSVGISVGRRGMHVGYNSRSGLYYSTGLPGSGIYYRKNLGKLKLPTAPALSPSTQPPDPTPASVKSSDAYYSSPAIYGNSTSNPFLVGKTRARTATYGCAGLCVGGLLVGLSPGLAIMSSLLGMSSFLAAEMFWMLAAATCSIGGFLLGGQKDQATVAVRNQEKFINDTANLAWAAIQRSEPAAAILHLEILREATPDNLNVLFVLSSALRGLDSVRGRRYCWRIRKRTSNGLQTVGDSLYLRLSLSSPTQ